MRKIANEEICKVVGKEDMLKLLISVQEKQLADLAEELAYHKDLLECAKATTEVWNKVALQVRKSPGCVAMEALDFKKFRRKTRSTREEWVKKGWRVVKLIRARQGYPVTVAWEGPVPVGKYLCVMKTWIVLGKKPKKQQAHEWLWDAYKAWPVEKNPWKGMKLVFHSKGKETVKPKRSKQCQKKK